MWAIDLQHVSYAYGDVQALRDLTLQVEEGACYALLGTNGAGKSTAIRLISGLLTPQGGTCTVLGQDMAQGAAAVRPYLAVSPQENAVAPRLTVRENLALIAGLYGAPRVSRNATVEARFPPAAWPKWLRGRPVRSPVAGNAACRSRWPGSRRRACCS